MILTLESGINAPSFISIFALCDFTIVSSYMKLLNGQLRLLYILLVYPSLVLFFSLHYCFSVLKYTGGVDNGSVCCAQWKKCDCGCSGV